MIKKPGTAEWELERLGAPERTPQPTSLPSIVPAVLAAQYVPLGLRRRDPWERLVRYRVIADRLLREVPP